MKRLVLCVLLAVLVQTAPAATCQWTNTLGGDWFTPTNWSPNVVPSAGDVVNITDSGTYAVTILGGGATVASLNLGGASGTQTLINATSNSLVVTTAGTIQPNGMLSITNGGLQGNVIIQPLGQLDLSGAGAKNLNSLVLINQGLVNWSGGTLQGGGTPTTVISNGGLWQVTSDAAFTNYWGNTMVWTNAGTLRKSVGSATSFLQGFNFVNLPGAVVDTLSGTLSLAGANSNILGGSFTATAPGLTSITGGAWTDAGGTASGTGTNRWSGAVLQLRTNIVAGLRLVGGEVYIVDTNGFQQAGAITNLTLEGAQLRGTNRIGAGTLTINAGGVDGQLTVSPAGQLLLASGSAKNLYSLVLNNQGSVTWSGGPLQGGGTPSTVISNGGLWQITSGATFTNYWGNTVGSSRVDLQACKLEYSIVSPK